MNLRRLIAAAAAVISVLVLQAMVITPVTAPWLVSLPAVLVAAIGLEAGVSAGLSVGFSTGLLADLGSQHPVGVLAIAWLCLGLGCGVLAEPSRRVVRSAGLVALATGLVSLVAGVALLLLDRPTAPLSTILGLVAPTVLLDALLAVLVVPVTRTLSRALRVRSRSAVISPGTVRARGTGGSIAPSRVAIDG